VSNLSLHGLRMALAAAGEFLVVFLPPPDGRGVSISKGVYRGTLVASRRAWANSMIANIAITTMSTTTDAAAMIGLT
jgi:hypothetical protein